MEAITNPVFRPRKNSKIITSPGHGAGWVSYAPHSASDAFLVWMLTYEPIISALEKKLPHERIEELLTDFHHEAKARFGVDRIVTARAGDLFVEHVGVAFEIRETDGQERVVDVSKRKEIMVPLAEGTK